VLNWSYGHYRRTLLVFTKKEILPPELVPQVWKLYRENKLDDTTLRRLKTSSPLGCILAAGLANRHHGRMS